MANQALPSRPNVPGPSVAVVTPAPLGQPSGAADPNAVKRGAPPQAGLPAVATPGPVTTPAVTVPAVKVVTGPSGAAVSAPPGPSAPVPSVPAARAPTVPAAPGPTGAPAVTTAGFAMPPFAGRGEAAKLDYLRSMALRLDSAVRGLIAVFAGTAGSAVPAADPTQLSQRVRERWARCDEHYLDLVSFSDAVQLIKDNLPDNPLVRRAADGLDNALQEMAALQECDNIVSMVNRPQGFDPWGTYYDASTRNFYRDWYTQLHAVHEAGRTFARQLNGMLSADRAIPPLAALPSAPPTAGAVVR